jgi:hypothetical protein
MALLGFTSLYRDGLEVVPPELPITQDKKEENVRFQKWLRLVSPEIPEPGGLRTRT